VSAAARVVGRIGGEAVAARPAPVRARPVPVLDALAVAVGRGLAWALVPRRPAATGPVLPDAGRGTPTVVMASPRSAVPARGTAAGRRVRLELVRGGLDGE
jgi:hypothetical protein